MGVMCVHAWRDKRGSIWRRLYDTALTLAAGVTLVPLALSGALSVFY
jgi:hypothetical protein